MMDYFYNKEITLLEETDGYLDRGVWVDGTLEETKTILCDLQPYSKERLYKDYGFHIDCTYRIFCDIDSDIKIGGKVKYKNTIYTIVKIFDWDDYFDMFINEVTSY